jgi:type II secretory pathway pseudopilin PulG
MALRNPGRGDGERAFTLVELTVALLAGLIVAMGIVSLSREATNTFHEEARSSAAEAALRTAMDRLRADVQRAGYMSTGNILWDPNLVHVPVPPGTAPGLPTVTAMKGVAGIKSLGSILLTKGGSGGPVTPLSGNQIPPLAPDRIQISGNMTVADQFDVAMISPQPNGNCRRIYLTPTAPALFRLLVASGGASAVELNNVFVPSAGGAQFIVRLVDNTGHSQFLATCSTGPGGIDGTGPYVDTDESKTPLIDANAAGTLAGPKGYCAGKCWINPVHIVQWELVAATAEPDPDTKMLGRQSTVTGTDPNKYDLLRSYVDANGTVVADTREVVAEYAVDLSFAFSVDQGTPTLPVISLFGFDDGPSNVPWAQVITQTQSSPGPQRIRSVQVRLATRTAQADRTVNITPVPKNYLSQTFIYRYCMTANCTTYSPGTPQWARVRTLTTEVSLPNQSRNFW